MSKLLLWDHFVSCLPSYLLLSLRLCMSLCVFSSVSLSSHVPCQDRLPVIEPFSPPDLTPECPVRTPSVGRYTHTHVYRHARRRPLHHLLHYQQYIFWDIYTVVLIWSNLVPLSIKMSMWHLKLLYPHSVSFPALTNSLVMYFCDISNLVFFK